MASKLPKVPFKSGDDFALTMTVTNKTSAEALTAVNHFEPNISLNGEFQSIYKAWEINPLTGLPWTIADANNALIGVRSRT